MKEKSLQEISLQKTQMKWEMDQKIHKGRQYDIGEII